MTSIAAKYSQRLTRGFALNGQGPSGSNYAAAFKLSDFETWYDANASKIKKVGSVYIIDGVYPGSTFLDVLLGNNGATYLDHTLDQITSKKTLRDLGSEIHIGTSAETNLLVFRRIQLAGLASNNGGSGDSEMSGYVVIECNASDLSTNNARFRVAVARV
jgi:hypothetical protein